MDSTNQPARFDLEPGDGLGDPADRLIEVLDRALIAAIDLSQARRTAARCLTISARVATGRRNGPDWVAEQLERLIGTWHGEDGDRPCA